MGEELTPGQQAAAFHGMATNRGRPPSERLALALQALDLYEAEVERLRAVPTYEQAITHLRDDDAFVAWMIAQPPGTSFKNDNQIGAAYLSARLTEETTNG